MDGWWMLLSATLSALAALCGGCLSGYFRSYARKKGENKADAEDVGKLTREVEGVRTAFRALEADVQHQRALVLERARATEGLRVVAAAERLKAHQEAFTRWQKLATTDSRDPHAGRDDMQWWLSNCLYLDDPARAAFLDAVNSFIARRELLNLDGVDRSDVAPKIVREGDTIRAAGNRIFEACGLPALNYKDLGLD